MGTNADTLSGQGESLLGCVVSSHDILVYVARGPVGKSGLTQVLARFICKSHRGVKERNEQTDKLMSPGLPHRYWYIVRGSFARLKGGSYTIGLLTEAETVC